MKLGKSELTRLLRECASICGIRFEGTFNSMRYTFAGLLYNLNFSGDQIRARLGQSSKQAYENYIRKEQEKVDWSVTQGYLERLSRNQHANRQLPQGAYSIRPHDFKKVYHQNKIAAPESMPNLNEDMKADECKQGANNSNSSNYSGYPSHYHNNTNSHSSNNNNSSNNSSHTLSGNRFARPRMLSPNPRRQLQLPSDMMFNPSVHPTDKNEFDIWTNKRRNRPCIDYDGDIDDVDDATNSNSHETYETNTELLFHSYSADPSNYNKQSASKPYVFNDCIDDPITQTQIMEDIDINCSFINKSKSESPIYPLTQKLPSPDIDNLSTKTQIEDEYPLTQTQFMDNEDQ